MMFIIAIVLRSGKEAGGTRIAIMPTSMVCGLYLGPGQNSNT